MTASVKRQEIYSDCSLRSGIAISAWYVDHSHFGAICVDATSSDSAETRAAIQALSHSTGPVNLNTDSANLVRALGLPKDSEGWLRAIAFDPALVTLRNIVAFREVSLVWHPGHGRKTPAGLKFCDILSRAISRRSESLHLQIGDALSTPDRPGDWVSLDTNLRMTFTPCTRSSTITHHLERKILPVLATLC